MQLTTPEPKWVGSVIETEGFYHWHVEEDFLTSSSDLWSDRIDLSFHPLLRSQPEGYSDTRRREIGERFEGKWVVVRGRPKVAPLGMLGRPTLFVEVEEINEAIQPPQPTTVSSADSRG